ncbi:ribosomal L7Ae/L30e/S12e/Gadd45 family protein [Desulfothermobacter acidiphilus]|uniref:ribosomal L7Ae/L30e/S12e/Gadd45 family protein n=1 Tax=Desulfothermobacter acidiphilus TaxID=1938353 RepID=UPI003F8C3B4B
MPYARISQARKKTVGSRQTLRAVERGQAKVVFVAADAESRITNPIVQAATARGVAVKVVPSMKELGRACGIEVSCASAAVLED